MNIEREIKLQLTRGAERSLAGLAPRRRSLASVYYDTPRHELRRAGVALRLRRDGARWLQTLKAEGARHAGLAARAEWELPVASRRLDPRAFPRDEVLSATGLDLGRVAGRLRPVFETRFVRRSGLVELDGKASAELAIDRGQILAGKRREAIGEVELELLSGENKALLRYAEGLSLPLAYESKAERGYRLAAGQPAGPCKWRMPEIAPDAMPGQAFAALFSAALAQAGTNAAGMAGSRDPEYLHQLRVGLRRLRSALRAFAPVLRGERALLHRLRRLMPALGIARDWDVLVGRLEKSRVRPSMLRAARARRNAERGKALALVASSEFHGVFFRSLRWIERQPWTHAPGTLADFARGRLEKLHRKVLRRADLERPRARHKLRVRIKRLRYACEFFAPCFPGEAARAYAKRLRTLQEVLGELNDLAVGRRLLVETRLAAPAAFGRRESQLRARLRAAWASFEHAPPYWRPAA